jgi:pyroglutamyl-peptidase
MSERVILVTGFEPFGPHAINPSEALAKAMDGRRFGSCVVRSATLPVHHRDARVCVDALVAELAPESIVHLGLANGRARLALERVAVNVMDYPIPDNAGRRVVEEPCIPGGPAAYFSTLPLSSILAALLGEGIPAYISNTAGTYLCNQTLYGTLHALACRLADGELRIPRAGFIHVPSSPAMVAASGLDEPSADLALMLRAVETVVDVMARGPAIRD